MIVHILPADGLGRGAPVVLAANLVLVMQDNGTPICVAGEYGPEHAQAVSMAGNEDFNETLQKLGIHKTVIVDRLKLPQPPQGARLIAGPRRL